MSGRDGGDVVPIESRERPPRGNRVGYAAKSCAVIYVGIV